MPSRLRILGIDPGSRATGFGIVDSDGIRSRFVASGTIKTGNGEFADRLKTIYEKVGQVVSTYEPDEIAVEKVFMHRNADSALKLGQARAAAICATFAGNSCIHEYAARAVKQAIVGSGGADKAQINHMVRHILNIADELGSDEADALAVALCHCHARPLSIRLGRRRGDAA